MTATLNLQPAAAPLLPPTPNAWFADARFGLFIHWGLYAVHGRGEWAFSREAWSMADYTRLAERFTAAEFDPRAWARLARAAGMRYVVLTTKHHDGFCLWDSALCPFNAVRASAAQRDLLCEFVAAVRAEGLKVGLYYSLGDWWHPDWARGWQGDAAAEARFMAYTHGLVRELMTGYGTIDLLFYDLPQCYSAAAWRAVELNAMVRQLQPGIVINNRALTTEDYATPEQHAAASAPGRPWEACMTLNDHWGYCPSDIAYKSPTAVALTLATCAAGQGNLLLNVGPDPAGRIPTAAVDILHAVGRWLSVHDEAIRGTDRNLLNWYLFGPTTVKGHTMYACVRQWYGSELIIGGLTRRVLRATLLSTGAPVTFMQRERQVILSDLPATSPDPVLPIIKLELDGPPDHDLSRVLGGADIFPEFPK